MVKRLRAGDDYAHGRCRSAPLGSGIQHKVRPSETYRADRSHSPWLTCVNCKKVLWGLHTIHEEPWW